MAEQRWRAAEVLRLGIGEGQQLVYARPNRAVRVLERQQAAFLASCDSFRTIDGHVRASAGNPNARAQLEAFARDGLLTSEQDLIARCLAARATAHPAGWPPRPISTVRIVTADRTTSLGRCLSSYAQNAQAHDRRTEFLVLDDARTAEARLATQKV